MPTIAQHLPDRNGDLNVGGNTRCATNLPASGVVQENDVITMTCSITYSGNWAPVMRWFNNSVSGVNYRPTAANQTSSRLTLTASTGVHGSKVVCLTYFTQPSTPLQTSATNIPSYTYTWTSPTLDVQCKLQTYHYDDEDVSLLTYYYCNLLCLMLVTKTKQYSCNCQNL